MGFLNGSAVGSLVTQVITGGVEATGLVVPLEPQDNIVKEILAVELAVQVVEFCFYAYLVYRILNRHISSSITSHRYFDWMITTPIMLINFIVFFKYLEQPVDTAKTFRQSIQEEAIPAIRIVIANALMLLFGYLGELGLLKTGFAVSLGFLPFAYIFKQLYSLYVGTHPVAKPLFYTTFGVWGLYGVAATLSFDTKNTMYNIIDLIAKNAFGLFLYAFIRAKQRQG